MLQKEQSSVKEAVKDLEASGANLTNTIFDLVSSDAGLSDRVAQVEASVVHETANISNALLIFKPKWLMKGDDIIFDDDVTNIGRAYDANTGKSTAPLGGLYFFIATASTTTAGEQANMHMVHGSTTVAQCFIGFNTFYEMGPQTDIATVHLRQRLRMFDIILHSPKVKYGGVSGVYAGVATGRMLRYGADTGD
nr:hypothetical protein BaRGS_030299 [Batillaria attramentaria]